MKGPEWNNPADPSQGMTVLLNEFYENPSGFAKNLVQSGLFFTYVVGYETTIATIE